MVEQLQKTFTESGRGIERSRVQVFNGSVSQESCFSDPLEAHLERSIFSVEIKMDGLNLYPRRIGCHPHVPGNIERSPHERWWEDGFSKNSVLKGIHSNV